MINAVMKMGFEILKSPIDLKLHHIAKIKHPDEFIRHLIFQDNASICYDCDPHEIWKPHFTEQPETDTDVGPLVS
jgi:hypothetical protein